MAISTWEVTNETTKKNIVIINASVNTDSPESFYYDQNIQLLPLLSDSLIAPGNTGSINIPEVKKDDTGYALPFTFIVAEAETLSPIKAISCKADLSDLTELVINDETLEEISSVFDFYKNITAFPGSELAISFTSLDYTNVQSVKDFFNNTEDYKRVTIEDIHLVSSYYKSLPYGWANGKNTVIYLYNQTQINNQEEGKVKSIGTVAITNDWTLPLPVNSSDQFKIEFKLNGEDAKQLVFNNGVFWDNAEKSLAKVCLAGSFFMPSQLMDDDSNNNKTICTFLVGAVNGASAFGFEGGEPDGDDDDGSFWRLIDVHNLRDGITLAMYAIGIVAAIVGIIKLCQFIKWCKERGNPAIDSNARRQQIENVQQHIVADSEQILRQVNQDIVVPNNENIQPAQNEYRAAQIKAKTAQSFENISRMVANQEKVLAAIGSKLSNAAIEDIVDRIEVVRNRLDRYDAGFNERVAEFRRNLPDTINVLTVNAKDITAAKTYIDKRLTSSEQRAYELAMNNFEKIYAEQNDVNDEMRRIEAGEDEREIIEEPVIE